MNQDITPRGWAYRSSRTSPNTRMHYFPSTVRFQLSACRRYSYRGHTLHPDPAAPRCEQCVERLAAATSQPASN